MTEAIHGEGMGTAHNATVVITEPLIVKVIRSVTDDQELVSALANALVNAGFPKDL